MIPKKASKLYRETAEELNVEEALVENFVEFLYKNVRGCLSNLSYPRINVEGLGHFNTKSSWIRRSIQRSTKLLENHDTSTFGAYSKKLRIQDKLDLLIELEKKITLEEQRKSTFKNIKYESIKTNLEGEAQDNGGN
jgi:nucleoid DNA-binding protein